MKNQHIFEIFLLTGFNVEEAWDGILEIAYTYKYHHEKIENMRNLEKMR